MADIIQRNLFTWKDVDAQSDLDILKLVLSALPDEPFMELLEKKRKGINDTYPLRACWNALIAGVVYQHPRAAALLRELKRNAELRDLCGFDPFLGTQAVPTPWAFSRFLAKVIAEKSAIQTMFDTLVDQVATLLPDFGKHLAVDGKALQTYAQGRKDPAQSSDPDADWGAKTYEGVREDGTTWKKVTYWFGYKLHLLVDSVYELPIAFTLTKASRGDCPELLPLVEQTAQKHPAVIQRAEELEADKGYDSLENIQRLPEEFAIHPIIDIRELRTVGDREITRASGKSFQVRALDPKVADTIFYNERGEVFCQPEDEQGRVLGPAKEMAFAGYEQDRASLKYRCPAAAYGCSCPSQAACGAKQTGFGHTVRVPLKTDPRVFTSVARSSYKWKKLYAQRSAVERVNYRVDRVFQFENHFIRGKQKMEMRIGLAMVVLFASAARHI